MSGQRVHASEQVVLTGPAFHKPRKQIVEALWVTLPRRNFRIIWGEYLNVKLTERIILKIDDTG